MLNNTTLTNGSKISTLPRPQIKAVPLNPTHLDKPAFLMNFPFSLSTESPNNIWMEELENRTVDTSRAIKQFSDMYHNLASDGLVYLIPTPPECGLQDLVYTANLAVVLEHLPARDTVVVSNFSTDARKGETSLGVRFFEFMGYETIVSPHRFEGEAELKHLYDNVYIGGYGSRSSIETYDWMERTLDMKIIKVEETDPYLYHLDTVVFPITSHDTLVCTENLAVQEVKEIEAHTNVIDVSLGECYSGICNSVRIYNTILNSSHIHELKAGTKAHAEELAKNRKLEDIASALGFEVNYVNLSEYHKSGALLSCMVMHLNRNSYNFTLL